MKRIFVALVAIAAACGGEKEPPIEYGPPMPPDMTELGAAQAAEATLQGTLAPAPTTQPSTGAPGLADRLVAQLGGYAAEKAMPTERSAKLAASAVSRAIDTGGIDPVECVLTTETSVTWSGCVVEEASTDPMTGDTMSMRVTVDGTLSWNRTTGLTTWSIHETMAMTQTQGAETFSMDATADLTGSVTATASTIVGDAVSDVHAGARITGVPFPIDQGIRTTLSLDLGYQPDPFCITSGTLVLEQRWTERPAGAREADLPNQGWRFEWTGGTCGNFTVASGS